MPKNAVNVLLRDLRTFLVERQAEGRSDRCLLEQFLSQRDEASFAALLERHGPMVLGVARRVVHDEHLAEDVFQATFLILARQAAAIRKRPSVGSWLHGIALRLARKAKTKAARAKLPDVRCQSHEMADPQAQAIWHEAQEILDDELQRLPESYRLPLVLCYLEGRTRDEAAEQLGWTVGKVKGLLDRGRDRLRSRLIRRGVTLSAAGSATLLADTVLATTVPPLLIVGTLRAAVSFVGGSALAPCGVSASVVALTEGGLRMLAAKKMTLIATLALVTGFLGAGVGLVAQRVDPVQAGPANDPPVFIAAQELEKKSDPKGTAVDRYGDALPDHAVARLGTQRFRHDWKIFATAISPDGQLVAAAGNRHVQVWNGETGVSLYRLDMGYNNGVAGLAFTSDGKRLAVYGGDLKLRIAQAATGKFVKQFDLKYEASRNAHTPPACVFLPDGKHLVLYDGYGTVVRLIDTEAGALVRPFRAEGKYLYALAISSDAKWLAVGEENGTVRLWEIATGQELRTLKKHSDYCVALAFAPDGKTLVSGAYDGLACVWDVASGKLVHALEPTVKVARGMDNKTTTEAFRNVRIGVKCVSFAPDGKTILTTNGYYAVIWDTVTGKEIRRVTHPEASMVRFLADEKTIFTGSEDAACHFLDAATGKPCRHFDGHISPLEAIAFSPDGKHVATSDRAEIRVWESDSQRVLVLKQRGQTGGQKLAFYPNGDSLAAGYFDNINFWDLKTRKSAPILPAQKNGRLLAVAYSLDGTKFAAAADDGIIRLWNLANPKVLQDFRVEAGNASTIAFSPDLRLAASGNQEKPTITLWDLATGKMLSRYSRGHKGAVRILFSPDARTLVEGGNEMQLWEIATGQRRRTVVLPGYTSCLAFSPDGRRIAMSAYPLRTNDAEARIPIHIHDLANNRMISSLLGHDSTVTALSFSPDGKRLASASADTTALLWDLSALPANKPSDPLTPDQRKACWADLAADAETAYTSMWKLADDKGTIDLLRKELSPVPPPPDPKLFSRLLADLKSDQFAVRAKAREELAKVAVAAEKELRHALTGNPSLEARRGVELLLQTVNQAEIRNRRAIEVLEGMNTPTARELLRGLARGASHARQTQEAQASLDRLGRRNRFR